MKNYIDRYVNLFSHKNEKILLQNNCIYRLYNNMVIPFGPASTDYSIHKKEAKKIRKSFKAHIVRTTSGFSNNISNEWYAVICSKFTPIEKLKSKYRNEVKKGLNNCIVKKIDIEFLANNGFEVYNSALKKYKNKANAFDNEGFRLNILQNIDFSDIFHTWGIFHNEKLIGYSEVYIFDKIEANYSVVKINPDYLHLYPSYALFYTMNKYYLDECKFQYINDGFCSISHDTNIQNLLIKKFGFEKKHTKLFLNYSGLLFIIINLLLPFYKIVNKINPKVGALLKLEQIRRNQK